MVVKKREIHSNPKSSELNEKEKRQISLCETALDALLRLEGCASVLIVCLKNTKIRNALEKVYTDAGWKVRFIDKTDSDLFYIDID